MKEAALATRLPVLQPPRLRDPGWAERLAALGADLAVVVAFGQILPKAVLEAPARGSINIHASLLPRYRGAAPIQWAIANGETVTGVTTMRIDEGLDTGDILLQKEITIAPEDTSETLAAKLAAVGADLMMETLRGLQAGSIRPQKQDNEHATPAPILKKEDGRIDFCGNAQEIYNRLRGFQPWPGAFTSFRGQGLNITAVKTASEQVPQGELLVRNGQLFVGCGNDSAIEVLELQPEGKRRMSARNFVHGYRPQIGERFGE